MIGEEATVQLLALSLQNTDGDINTRITQTADAPTLHLGKLIDAADNDTAHALPDNQVGTGRRLTVVGTRLQRDVHRSPVQQCFIIGTYRGKGVHLGMTLATTHMVTLADNPICGRVNNHSPYHRIRLRILSAAACQLQTAAHIFLVFSYTVHAAKLQKKLFFYTFSSENLAISKFIHIFARR